MADITVCYLARRAEGFGKFGEFAESFRAHDAGMDHDLLVIAKGFDSVELQTLSKIFEGIDCRFLEVPDDIGFDLHAYLFAIEFVNSRIVCFLNTHVRLRADKWLQKLYTALDQDNVGLVGAFGSYESLGRFRRRRTRRLIAGISTLLRNLLAGNSKKKIIPEVVGSESDVFPPFPNPHIRSNVFMLRREIFRKMEAPQKTKLSCYHFESGPRGLTATVRNLGLRTLVVGANGRFFSENDWPVSGGYRSGDQSNLLAEDNVTDLFRNASARSRASILKRTWGTRRDSSARNLRRFVAPVFL